ncbi:MAG: hypothetical protein WA843_03955 [Candidatus Saccharimonadales bacterium]
MAQQQSALQTAPMTPPKAVMGIHIAGLLISKTAVKPSEIIIPARPHMIAARNMTKKFIIVL